MSLVKDYTPSMNDKTEEEDEEEEEEEDNKYANQFWKLNAPKKSKSVMADADDEDWREPAGYQLRSEEDPRPMKQLFGLSRQMQTPMQTPTQTSMQTPMQTSMQTPMQTPTQISMQTSMQTSIPPIEDQVLSLAKAHALQQAQMQAEEQAKHISKMLKQTRSQAPDPTTSLLHWRLPVVEEHQRLIQMEQEQKKEQKLREESQTREKREREEPRYTQKIHDDNLVDLVQSIPQKITQAFIEMNRNQKDRNVECCLENINEFLDNINSELIKRTNALENQIESIMERLEGLYERDEQRQIDLNGIEEIVIRIYNRNYQKYHPSNANNNDEEESK
jgi:hypothetical protein